MKVIDTNVVISLILEPNGSKEKFVFENDLIAPSFLKLELLNVLRKYHFLKSIPLSKIEQYNINGIELFSGFTSDNIILPLARKLSFDLNHPIYDCLFLALAIESNSPFISFDKRLIVKAQSVNIDAFEFNH